MTQPLPDPRKDGRCCDCAQRQAVTDDGRFCRACLKKLVARLTPMVGCFKGRQRTSGHMEDRGTEPNPSQENAVRHLEG